MKDILRLVIVLTLISSAAGVILAVTNKVTSGPIASAGQREHTESLTLVLPACDNDPARTKADIVVDGRAWTFHVARKAGRYAGAAFVAVSRRGYGGDIRLMVGVTAGGTVNRVRVLSQQETPGLGTKVAAAPFISQFDGRTIADTRWAVRKDQGDFDAVTGATISSRAVLEAVRAGLDVYRDHVAEIARTGE
jgi:electron transport complex protein RnfG